MITDHQVRKLRMELKRKGSLGAAAAAAGMSEKTARKYLKSGQLPSESRKPRDWRTRKDPFVEVWPELEGMLKDLGELSPLTVFEYLQRRYPGRFQEGQLRTLQRRVKQWRALHGSEREVFFEQVHEPGELAQSDFTSMNDLGITIAGQRFDHLLYHFILPFSNWEWASVCFSESFESLSEGLQDALWRLGGLPQAHQTDQLSAAVHQDLSRQIFTDRYQGLLDHYGLEGRHIRVRKPNENGDVEQGHHRLVWVIKQAVLLRGSRDFADRDAYNAFLHEVLSRRNAARSEAFQREAVELRPLPARRLDAVDDLRVKVGRGSTIRVRKNTYSVDNRLIGETLRVRLYAEELELWYGQKLIDTLPRLRGSGRARINYRHIIDSLVRKPGAFAGYRHREELFPGLTFRAAYDSLCARQSRERADRVYLSILHLAARESESAVREILDALLATGETISELRVRADLSQYTEKAFQAPVGQTTQPDLNRYDGLLPSSNGEGVA